MNDATSGRLRKIGHCIYKITQKVALVLIIWLMIGMIFSLLFYDKGTYDCKHMTRDFEDVVESVGIPVQIVTGYIERGGSGHMWALVFGLQIDTTFLFPWPNSLFYPADIKIYEDYDDYLRSLS